MFIVCYCILNLSHANILQNWWNNKYDFYHFFFLQKLSSPTLSVNSESFIPLLAQLDECISYISSSVSHVVFIYWHIQSKLSLWPLSQGTSSSYDHNNWNPICTAAYSRPFSLVTSSSYNHRFDFLRWSLTRGSPPNDSIDAQSMACCTEQQYCSQILKKWPYKMVVPSHLEILNTEGHSGNIKVLLSIISITNYMSHNILLQPQYKESSIYLTKFKNCLNQSLHLIKSHVISLLKNATMQVLNNKVSVHTFDIVDIVYYLPGTC